MLCFCLLQPCFQSPAAAAVDTANGLPCCTDCLAPAVAWLPRSCMCTTLAAPSCPSATASLEQQEPLAAAGVPEERRQFEVTVANILQVRGWLVVGERAMVPKAACCRLGARRERLRFSQQRPPTPGHHNVRGQPGTCSPFAGSPCGSGAPPGGLHKAWRLAGPLRCVWYECVLSRKSKRAAAALIAEAAACSEGRAGSDMLLVHALLPPCRHSAGADAGCAGGIWSLL